MASYLDRARAPLVERAPVMPVFADELAFIEMRRGVFWLNFSAFFDGWTGQGGIDRCAERRLIARVVMPCPQISTMHRQIADVLVGQNAPRPIALP